MGNGSMIVWAEKSPKQYLELARLELVKGDISRAISWFKDNTGQEPKQICLNPNCERLAVEAGDSIQVNYVGGCLAWEVWLSAEESFKTPKLAPLKVDPTQTIDAKDKEVLLHTNAPLEPSVTKPSHGKEIRPIISLGGRPKKNIPIDLVHKLSEQGLSTTDIAKKLKAKGCIVSRIMVSRILSGERK